MSEKGIAELGAAEKTTTVETVKPQGPIDGIQLEQLMLEHMKVEEGEEPAPQKQAENPPPDDPVSAEDSEDGDKVDLSQDDAEAESAEEVEGEPETTEEEAETAETDEQDADLTERAQKRINQLVRQKKEAQEESEELRAQLKDKPNAAEPILVSNALNPFFKLQNQSEVEAEIKKQREIRSLCEMNPEGMEITGENGKEYELSAEEIRVHKVKAMDALEQHLPDQRKYVRESKEWNAETEKAFPFWKDRSSAAYQEAREFLEKVPEMQRMPSYKYLIGATMLGLATLNKDAKAGQKAKKAPIKKAPSQPKASPSPAAIPKEAAKKQDAYDRFAKSSGESQRDLTDYFM